MYTKYDSRSSRYYSNANILGRGAFVIAAIDIVISCIWIVMFTKALITNLTVSPGGWTLFKYAQSDNTLYIGIILGVCIINLFFGILLLIGAITGKSILVLSWYGPNLITILCVVILSLVLAFTEYAILSLYLPPTICFRSFEIWIVHEYYYDIKYNRY